MSVIANRPFTPEWAAAFQGAIEADLAYRELAAKWTWPVALVIDAAPKLGYHAPVAVELALEGGRCQNAVIRHADAVTAPFTLRAAYATWKLVMRGELDPLAGVSRGKIRVSGSVATLLLHASFASALRGCPRAVPTDFPDES